MQHLIHHYKLRLTNLSQGNRSLKLARLSKRKDLDLTELAFLEEQSAEELLQKIIAGRSVSLIQRLDPRYERTNLTDRRLNRIFREVNALFEETGTRDLFVGYPFVEGKFIDGTVARCPVALFPVRLVRDLQQRPRWKLERIKGEEIEVNKTFFMAYEQFQQVRLPAAFWEGGIPQHMDWQDWLSEWYQQFKAYELGINFNPRLFDRKLTSFVDYTAPQLRGLPLGVLKFQPMAVLGMFPQSDSALLQNYEAIEERPDAFPLLSLLGDPSTPLPGASQEASQLAEHAAPSKEDYIREEHRYFVTPVDATQELALLKIKQGQSLVIHGPPGTGKSQVIVNIMADAMAHGKKVLLVSQKRAALDVVYKRLSALRLDAFTMLVHDYRQDRAQIYRKLKRQIDELDTYRQDIRDLNITKWEHDYKLLSRQADQYNRKFEELYQALIQPQSCGRSAHELYLLHRPQHEPLPLAELAKKLDEQGLTRLLERLDVLLAYHDLFHPDHPWRERLPLHQVDYDEQQRRLSDLRQLPERLRDLHQRHQSLRQQLGTTDLLDLATNRAHLHAYREVATLLAQPELRADVEAIQADELSTEYIETKLRHLGQVIKDMEALYILRSLSPAHFDTLSRHVKQYEQQQRSPLRFFSLKFLRARWYLKQLLNQRQLPLDEANFNQLFEEYTLFRRLNWHYVRIHEQQFFSDFPLLEGLGAKQQWLERKARHLEAYRRITGLQPYPSLKPRFVFGRLEETPWQRSLATLQQLEAFTQRWEEALRQWRSYLHETQLAPLRESLRQPRVDTAYAERLLAHFERDFSDLQLLDQTLSECSPAEWQAIQLLRPHLSRPEEHTSLKERVQHSVYFYWIEQIERRHPVLREVSGRGWEHTLQDYARKLAARQAKVTELVQRRLKEHMIEIIEYNRLKNPVTYRTIYHQVSKQRRIWPVRKLVKETWHKGLQQLAPCWMASPESAAAMFPMQPDFFDIVIFDEASQCFVERALPVMLRARQCVVAGDHLQLQPMNLYAIKYEEGDAIYEEEEIALEVESALDLAKTVFEEQRLRWHYRSRDEALIHFSNALFYEGKLKVVPQAKHDPLYAQPLSWVSVPGIWHKHQNEAEARKVIELILQLLDQPDRPSIGVVTFNYHQQELIKDLLDETSEQLAMTDEARYFKLQAALRQTENEEFVGIFVKNIENVQGDERDIIIFSVGYGYNHAGKLNTQFGLLNQRGGENRLNVAVTRARRKVYVVCSFSPGELKVEQATHKGPRYLKAYLAYVKAMSEGRMEEALQLLATAGDESLATPRPNPIAAAIAPALRQAGYELVRDLGDTAYKLDLAVRRPGSADYLLGIECEGSHYFSGISSKEREVYRRKLLEAHNWHIHRVWARNFWLDSEGEIQCILDRLASMQGA